VKIRKEINASSAELSESLITGKPCDKSKYSNKYYDDQALGYIAMWDFAGSRALERLSMYERRLEASLFRTMAELKKLQYVRKSEQAGSTQAEAAIPPLGKAATDRQTQGRDALATEARRDSVEEQSQFAADPEELSAFEKREYELLLGAAPTPDKANDPQQKTQDAGQKTQDEGRKTENSLRRKVTVCRY